MEDDAYNDKFPVTSGIRRRSGETEEGQKIMCEIIEKLCSKVEAKGQARINILHALLIDAGRYDDLKRSTTDASYQTQLMHELLPEELA